MFRQLYLRRHSKEYAKYCERFKNSPKKTMITLGDFLFLITLDWEAIIQHVRAELDDPTRVIYGGLICQWNKPSFSACSDESDIIIINPGNLLVRIYLSFFPDPTRQLERQVAYLLAHELGHLLQRHRGYGWIGEVMMPVIMFGIPLAAASTPLAATGQISWLVSGGILAGWYGATKLYQWHPLEADANHYARDHWKDWAQYVSVQRIMSSAK